MLLITPEKTCSFRIGKELVEWTGGCGITATMNKVFYTLVTKGGHGRREADFSIGLALCKVVPDCGGVLCLKD